MRPPRLRCTLFSLIYPPHLLGSYKRQLYGFVLFSRLTKRNLASYVISVRRTKSSLTASFRFYLTIDTLAVQLYTSLSPRRVRDFHPLERAHGAQTKNNGTSVGLDSLSFGIQPDLSWVKTVITHVRILLVFRVKINISDFCRKKKSLTEY